MRGSHRRPTREPKWRQPDGQPLPENVISINRQTAPVQLIAFEFIGDDEGCNHDNVADFAQQRRLRRKRS